MKQKMVIKVSANCEKCRKKAMQVAAVADGLMSVALEGDFRDKLVVIGDGVDAACLVAALRKKACHATLQSLEEVKPPPTVEVKPKPDGNKEVKDKEQPPFEMCKVVYDSYGPTTGCIIM